MREGISVIQCGPSLETPAELRMMRAFGADVVGPYHLLSTTIRPPSPFPPTDSV